MQTFKKLPRAAPKAKKDTQKIAFSIFPSLIPDEGEKTYKPGSVPANRR